MALALGLVLEAAAQATNQPGGLPANFSAKDINTTGGSTTVDANGLWTIKADGRDIGGTSDSFHFAFRSFQGDGSMVARIASLTGGDPALAKFGPMIRATDAAGAQNVFMPATSDGRLLFRFRAQPDQDTSSANLISPPAKAPAFLRLQRVGSDFAGFVSDDGKLWRAIGAVRTIPMPDTALFGLAATSGKDGQIMTATASNVEAQPGVFSAFGLNACLSANGVLLTMRTLPVGVVGFKVFRGAVDATFDKFVLLTPNTVTGTTFAAAAADLVPGTTVVFAVQTFTRDAAGKLVEGPIVALPVTPIQLPTGFSVCSISEGVSLGTVVIDPATGLITVRGTGGEFRTDLDRVFFLFRQVEGKNFRITATLPTLPSLTSEAARGGIMLRESLEPGARFVSLTLTPSRGLVLEARKAANSTSEADRVSRVVLTPEAIPAPLSLRLIRDGDTIYATISRDGGQTFVRVGDPITFPDLAKTLYVGVVATGDPTNVTEVKFSNILVTTP